MRKKRKIYNSIKEKIQQTKAVLFVLKSLVFLEKEILVHFS